ncbi:GlsB/YeaQ/YmgE family stress response membrane protein [Streptomyces sp. HNM0574]|nr:GlsB/YeaQ/YmgE family stress response membrane protein [Streptomyces sp. HNM0574]
MAESGAENDLGDALSEFASSGIVSWLILGLIAGTVAKVLLPGRDPGGIVGTALIGVAGAFLGGWLSATFLDKPVSNNFVDPALWVSAIAGSLVLLVGYRIFFGHSRERR